MSANQSGPYVIDENPGRKFWCACGATLNQPYCDGSHKKNGVSCGPVAVEIKEAGKVAWCGCRKTRTPPFCDGTHRHLG